VIGPDEYHERVDNNAFTNRLAAFCLEQARALDDEAGKRSCYGAPAEGESRRCGSSFRLLSAGGCNIKRSEEPPEAPARILGARRPAWRIQRRSSAGDVIAMMQLFAEEFSDEQVRKIGNTMSRAPNTAARFPPVCMP
jgi:hypothetical protein